MGKKMSEGLTNHSYEPNKRYAEDESTRFQITIAHRIIIFLHQILDPNARFQLLCLDFYP